MRMMRVRVQKILLLFLPFIPLGRSYCSTPGWNPRLTGPPIVEQLSITSVRVSWAGLLETSVCADFIKVKHWRGMNIDNWRMSDQLSVDTHSYIVKNLVPNVPYTFQVIAAEDKGYFLGFHIGIDYNRGPKTRFVIKTRQKQVKADDPIPNETTTEDWVDIDTNARMGSESSSQAVKAKSTDQTNAEGASSENVMEQIEDVIAQLLAGEKTELLVGLIVGGLVLVVLIIGLVYNCVQRSGPPKHLDLDFAMYEADSDEDSDSGSKVLNRPKKAKTIERRSGVVSFLASIGKRGSNTDSITSQTV